MGTLVELRKLAAEGRRELERLARSGTEDARPVKRSKIVSTKSAIDGREAPFAASSRYGDGWGDAADDEPRTVNLPAFIDPGPGGAPDGRSHLKVPSGKCSSAGYWLIKY
jgi:hypothetical protein